MKKLLLLFLLLTSIVILGGCAKDSHLKNLKGEELFTQEENSYFVFLYKKDHEEYENTAAIVESYLHLVEDQKEYKNKSKIYGFDLSKEPNSQIFREYKGKNGQGDNGTFYVNDVQDWEDLYIGTPVALISIRTRDGVKYANFEAEGYEAISARLQDHLE